LIQLHLRIRVAPGQREALLAFLRDAIPYYEAPGEIRVRLLAASEDSEQLIEVVEYATRDAYVADQQRVEHDVHMRDLISRWRALLDGPPVVEVYEDIAIAPNETESGGADGAGRAGQRHH
jgi:quinol monooxygenase YgiN